MSSGSGSPRVLVVQIPRQRLVWWEDGDAWEQSVTVDEDYPWQLQSQQQWAFSKAVTDDDVWAPTAAAPAFDEDYWLINQHVPHVFARAFNSDDDVWPTGIHFDEDYLWSNRQSPYFAPLQAFRSDDDVWPTPVSPFGIDDDYLWSNRFSGYFAPLQAFRSDDDVWTPSLKIDDDYWLIGKYSGYFVPLQAFKSDDDAWPVPVAPVTVGAMPNLVGLRYPEALDALVAAGLRILPFVYFRDDPVLITWAQSKTVLPGFVISQSPAPGTPGIVPNSPTIMVVSNYPFSVTYPAGAGNV